MSECLGQDWAAVRRDGTDGRGPAQPQPGNHIKDSNGSCLTQRENRESPSVHTDDEKPIRQKEGRNISASVASVTRNELNNDKSTSLHFQKVGILSIMLATLSDRLTETRHQHGLGMFINHKGTSAFTTGRSKVRHSLS